MMLCIRYQGTGTSEFKQGYNIYFPKVYGFVKHSECFISLYNLVILWEGNFGLNAIIEQTCNRFYGFRLDKRYFCDFYIQTYAYIKHVAQQRRANFGQVQ